MIVYAGVFLREQVEDAMLEPKIFEQNENVSDLIKGFHGDLENTEYIDQFLRYGSKNDASSYLNKIIKWKNVQKYKINSNKTIHLEKRNLLGAAWEERSPAEVRQFSTRWMRKLNQFDHWNLENSAPVKHAIKKGKVHPELHPTPVLYPFSTWARILLIQSKGWKSSDNALKVLVHLCKLLYSTERKEALGVVLQIISITKIFYDRFNSRFRQRHQFFENIGVKQFSSMLFMPYFAQIGFNYSLRPDLMKLFYSKRGWGICAGINEGGWHAIAVKTLAKTKNSEWLANATEIIRSSVGYCNLSHLSRSWSKKFKLSNLVNAKMRKGYLREFHDTADNYKSDVLAKTYSYFATQGYDVMYKPTSNR